MEREKHRLNIIENYYERGLIERSDNILSFKSNIFVINQYDKYIHEAYVSKQITPKQYVELFSKRQKAIDSKMEILFVEGVPHIKEEWP